MGQVFCPSGLALFSSPSREVLLGYMGKTLLIQVSTHWLLPHSLMAVPPEG